MEMVELLQRYKGRPVTLEFDDGEVVDAKVVHIDTEDHMDFTYDVLAIRNRGPRTNYDRQGAYVMPLDSIRGIRPLDDAD